MFCKRVGFYPFRRPDASLTLRNRNTRPAMSVLFGFAFVRAASSLVSKNTLPETTYEAH
jgi:hypothetical protein